MHTYTTPYVFREFPKFVHGVIVQDAEEEAVAKAKHEAKEREQAAHAEKIEAEASEQAIGEMQEAIRREKRRK